MKFNNKHLREELELYKASLEDITQDTQDVIQSVGEIAHLINNSKYPNIVWAYLKQYYKDGLLTPLKLDDDEFPFTGEVDRTNKRYNGLYLNVDDDIIYKNAWQAKIVHVYDVKTKEEKPIFPDYIDVFNDEDTRLYITKGGVCKGDYIDKIRLSEDTVNKHSFWPHPPINIPCSVEIMEDDDYRFSVDCREPKLNALLNFYYTYIHHDDNIKFDIRKYKKLNKNGNS